MLRDLRLSVRDPADGAGATREISLRVADGDAHVTLYRRDVPGGDEVVECRFRLPARSLLLALRAAWDDARSSGAWCDRTASASTARPTAPTPERTEVWRSSRPIA